MAVNDKKNGKCGIIQEIIISLLRRTSKHTARRKLSERNIRKIIKNGDSYAVTIPIEIMKEFKCRTRNV